MSSGARRSTRRDPSPWQSRSDSRDRSGDRWRRNDDKDYDDRKGYKSKSKRSSRDSRSRSRSRSKSPKKRRCDSRSESRDKDGRYGSSGRKRGQGARSPSPPSPDHKRHHSGSSSREKAPSQRPSDRSYKWSAGSSRPSPVDRDEEPARRRSRRTSSPWKDEPSGKGSKTQRDRDSRDSRAEERERESRSGPRSREPVIDRQKDRQQASADHTTASASKSRSGGSSAASAESSPSGSAAGGNGSNSGKRASETLPTPASSERGSPSPAAEAAAAPAVAAAVGGKSGASGDLGVLSRQILFPGLPEPSGTSLPIVGNTSPEEQRRNAKTGWGKGVLRKAASKKPDADKPAAAAAGASDGKVGAEGAGAGAAPTPAAAAAEVAPTARDVKVAAPVENGAQAKAGSGKAAQGSEEAAPSGAESANLPSADEPQGETKVEGSSADAASASSSDDARRAALVSNMAATLAARISLPPKGSVTPELSAADNSDKDDDDQEREFDDSTAKADALAASEGREAPTQAVAAAAAGSAGASSAAAKVSEPAAASSRSSTVASRLHRRKPSMDAAEVPLPPAPEQLSRDLGPPKKRSATPSRAASPTGDGDGAAASGGKEGKKRSRSPSADAGGGASAAAAAVAGGPAGAKRSKGAAGSSGRNGLQRQDSAASKKAQEMRAAMLKLARKPDADLVRNPAPPAVESPAAAVESETLAPAAAAKSGGGKRAVKGKGKGKGKGAASRGDRTRTSSVKTEENDAEPAGNEQQHKSGGAPSAMAAEAAPPSEASVALADAAAAPAAAAAESKPAGAAAAAPAVANGDEAAASVLPAAEVGLEEPKNWIRTPIFVEGKLKESEQRRKDMRDVHKHVNDSHELVYGAYHLLPASKWGKDEKPQLLAYNQYVAPRDHMAFARVKARFETRRSDRYSHVEQFLLEMRRIAANGLRFCASMSEDERKGYVNQKGARVGGYETEVIPKMLREIENCKFASLWPLAPGWEKCLQVVTDLRDVKGEDGLPLAARFTRYVETNFKPSLELPADYIEKAGIVLDFGTVISRLLEGETREASKFVGESAAVLRSSRRYWSQMGAQGKPWVAAANQLEEELAASVQKHLPDCVVALQPYADGDEPFAMAPAWKDEHAAARKAAAPARRKAASPRQAAAAKSGNAAPSSLRTASAGAPARSEEPAAPVVAAAPEQAAPAPVPARAAAVAPAPKPSLPRQASASSKGKGRARARGGAAAAAAAEAAAAEELARMIEGAEAVPAEEITLPVWSSFLIGTKDLTEPIEEQQRALYGLPASAKVDAIRLFLRQVEACVKQALSEAEKLEVQSLDLAGKMQTAALGIEFKDIPGPDVADYRSLVTNPVAIKTIRTGFKKYLFAREFCADLDLLVRNAEIYNLPDENGRCGAKANRGIAERARRLRSEVLERVPKLLAEVTAQHPWFARAVRNAIAAAGAEAKAPSTSSAPAASAARTSSSSKEAAKEAAKAKAAVPAAEKASASPDTKQTKEAAPPVDVPSTAATAAGKAPEPEQTAEASDAKPAEVSKAISTPPKSAQSAATSGSAQPAVAITATSFPTVAEAAEPSKAPAAASDAALPAEPAAAAAAAAAPAEAAAGAAPAPAAQKRPLPATIGNSDSDEEEIVVQRPRKRLRPAPVPKSSPAPPVQLRLPPACPVVNASLLAGVLDPSMLRDAFVEGLLPARLRVQRARAAAATPAAPSAAAAPAAALPKKKKLSGSDYRKRKAVAAYDRDDAPARPSKPGASRPSPVPSGGSGNGKPHRSAAMSASTRLREESDEEGLVSMQQVAKASGASSRGPSAAKASAAAGAAARGGPPTAPKTSSSFAAPPRDAKASARAPAKQGTFKITLRRPQLELARATSQSGEATSKGAKAARGASPPVGGASDVKLEAQGAASAAPMPPPAPITVRPNVYPAKGARLGPAKRLPMAPFSRPLDGWEKQAKEVLTRLHKLEWVKDLYSQPVAKMYPHIAEAYLSMIKKPLDMSKLKYMLEARQFSGAQDFANHVLLMFNNAIEYSKRHMEDIEGFAHVKTAKHLRRVARWLCLEVLEIKQLGGFVGVSVGKDHAFREEEAVSEVLDAAKSLRKNLARLKQLPAQPSKFKVELAAAAGAEVDMSPGLRARDGGYTSSSYWGDSEVARDNGEASTAAFEAAEVEEEAREARVDLTVRERDRQRQRREKLLARADIVEPAAGVIKALLNGPKQLSANNKLAGEFWLSMASFLPFLRDYLSEVGEPVDLGTITEKISGQKGGKPDLDATRCEYKTHGQLLADVRRMLDNAIYYNAGISLRGDKDNVSTTSVPEKVFQQAVMLKHRIGFYVHTTYSIDAIELAQRLKLTAEVGSKRRQEHNAKQLKIREANREENERANEEFERKKAARDAKRARDDAHARAVLYGEVEPDEEEIAAMEEGERRAAAERLAKERQQQRQKRRQREELSAALAKMVAPFKHKLIPGVSDVLNGLRGEIWRHELTYDQMRAAGYGDAGAKAALEAIAARKSAEEVRAVGEAADRAAAAALQSQGVEESKNSAEGPDAEMAVKAPQAAAAAAAPGDVRVESASAASGGLKRKADVLEPAARPAKRVRAAGDLADRAAAAAPEGEGVEESKSSGTEPVAKKPREAPQSAAVGPGDEGTGSAAAAAGASKQKEDVLAPPAATPAREGKLTVRMSVPLRASRRQQRPQQLPSALSDVFGVADDESDIEEEKAAAGAANGGGGGGDDTSAAGSGGASGPNGHAAEEKVAKGNAQCNGHAEYDALDADEDASAEAAAAAAAAAPASAAKEAMKRAAEAAWKTVAMGVSAFGEPEVLAVRAMVEAAAAAAAAAASGASTNEAVLDVKWGMPISRVTVTRSPLFLNLPTGLDLFQLLQKTRRCGDHDLHELLRPGVLELVTIRVADLPHGNFKRDKMQKAVEVGLNGGIEIEAYGASVHVPAVERSIDMKKDIRSQESDQWYVKEWLKDLQPRVRRIKGRIAKLDQRPSTLSRKEREFASFSDGSESADAVARHICTVLDRLVSTKTPFKHEGAFGGVYCSRFDEEVPCWNARLPTLVQATTFSFVTLRGRIGRVVAREDQAYKQAAREREDAAVAAAAQQEEEAAAARRSAGSRRATRPPWLSQGQSQQQHQQQEEEEAGTYTMPPLPGPKWSSFGSSVEHPRIARTPLQALLGPSDRKLRAMVEEAAGGPLPIDSAGFYILPPHLKHLVPPPPPPRRNFDDWAPLPPPLPPPPAQQAQQQQLQQQQQQQQLQLQQQQMYAAAQGAGVAAPAALTPQQLAVHQLHMQQYAAAVAAQQQQLQQQMQMQRQGYGQPMTRSPIAGRSANRPGNNNRIVQI